MSFSALSQAVVSGALEGGFLALAASGFSLIFGVQRILNVAHGTFMVLAAFVTVQFSMALTPALRLDPLFSMPLDFGLVAVVGGGLYLLVIARAEKSGFEAPLLATFGISMLLQYLFANGLGPLPPLDPSAGVGAMAQSQTYSSTAFRLGPVFVPEAQLIAFGLALAVIPLLHLFLRRARLGRAIRATAQDHEAAEFSGVNTRNARLASFLIGSGLAGVAGSLLSFIGSVTPGTGDSELLPVVIVVVFLGGLGSLGGTLAAGLLVGVVQSLSSLAALSLPLASGFHADLGSLLTFSLFLAVLMLRPTGLFGKGAVT